MSRVRWIPAAGLAGALAVAIASPAFAGKTTQPPDLSGQWLLDRSRSETPSPRGGMGGWGGRHGGGGGFPGGGGGFPGGRAGGGEWGREPRGEEEGGPADSTRGAGRTARLPDRIRIRESGGNVVVSDSTGADLLEIRAAGPAGSADARGASAATVLLDGKWKGDRLEVERTGPRGGTIKETYRLEDKGRSLVVETKIERNGRRPAMSFKRVYERVSA